MNTSILTLIPSLFKTSFKITILLFLYCLIYIKYHNSKVIYIYINPVLFEH